MYRAIPVANKAVADRDRARSQALHEKRIRAMKSQVDTQEPSTVHLDHVRNNLKREQLLEERYHEIDRENSLLLQKMSNVMKTKPHATPRSKSGPISLNRDGRKKELMRITRENTATMKRIQQSQPVYNRVAWEDSYRKSFTYLKNTAEYPVALRQSPKRAASLTLLPLGGQATAGTSQQSDRSRGRAGGNAAKAGDDELQYVFKEGKRIGNKYYLIEMATDGRTLAVSAYEGDSQKTLELVVNERNHRRLYRETNGDYTLMADRLRVEDGHLVLDSSGGPLENTSGSMGSTV